MESCDILVAGEGIAGCTAAIAASALGANVLMIEKSPYCAYKVTGGFTFTFGGLWTNAKGQVLDSSRKPIPALYAAGEITTGIFYANYAGGSSLPRCAVYGRIAGESAAEYIRQ